jgi:hypothetical protein
MSEISLTIENEGEVVILDEFKRLIANYRNGKIIAKDLVTQLKKI